MATFYALTVPEFVAELGLSGRDAFDLEWCLSAGEGALIAARTGLSAETAQAMTFRDLVPAARMMIARKNRHHCPLCPSDVHRKSTALPWRSRCPFHGAELHDATGATLSNMLGAGRFSELKTCADGGAAVLDAWARGEEQKALGPDEMLAFLTARRDNREFLTTPIIRCRFCFMAGL